MQCELCPTNLVGEAANYPAEMVLGADSLIFAQGLQAKHDVVELP